MKITVFTPTLEGLYDEDYSPEVFEGHLTLEQIESIAYAYQGAYAQYAVSGNPAHGYYISYNNYPRTQINPTQVEPPFTGSCFYQGEEGTGHLTYHVTFTETKQL